MSTSAPSLQEIKSSPVIAEWVFDALIPGNRATLTLPGGNINIIELSLTREGEKTVIGAGLTVPKQFRRHGIATRLVRAGLALAKKYDAERSEAHITSPYSLMIRRGIFGDSNLSVFLDTPDQYTEYTIEEGLAKNKLLTEDGDGLTAISELGKLCVDGWELPKELNPPDPLPYSYSA